MKLKGVFYEEYSVLILFYGKTAIVLIIRHRGAGAKTCLIQP